MGKGGTRDTKYVVKKAEEDDSESELGDEQTSSRSSNRLKELAQKPIGIKKEVEQKGKKKLQMKRKPSSSSSSSSSYSSDYSEEQNQTLISRKKKKVPKQIKDYLDIQASSSSGQEFSQPGQDDDPEAQAGRKQYEAKYNRLYRQTQKTKNEILLDHLEGKNQRQIESRYKEMAKYKDSQDKQQMIDNYRDQADLDLHQIKCEKGKEEELVQFILNKAKYVYQHPDQFFCKIVTAMALPKKFPGYIFLEGRDLETIRKSIQNFKGLVMNSLKKIEFQIYSHLFDEAYQKINDFKLNQYVKIKFGAYKDDIGQITQINKNGVTVQLVPRISFDLIDLRMKQMDDLKGTEQETHIFKKKNQILKRLTSPKVTYKAGQLPPKKKLTQSDFFKYNQFPHNKSIKITEEGLILANYLFNQIGYSKTMVSSKDILQLNPQTNNPQFILQQEVKYIKLERDIHPNQLVEIVSGELKGVFGRVYEKTNKLVRVTCLNSDIKGLIVDQLMQNLQKKFIQGQRVVVVEGNGKGEQGIVFSDSKKTVSIFTSNNQKLQCFKRNVQSYNEGKIKLQNDLGIKVHSLIRIINGNEFGIVCSTKKTYIQYVNNRNHLMKARNGEFDIIQKPNGSGLGKDNKQIKRNCLVQIMQGQKQNQILKVKFVYKQYLFLQDRDSLSLYGNWVQKAQRCNLYIKNAPKNHAQFLNNRFKKRSEFLNQPKRLKFKINIQAQNDEFKVGNQYRLLQGVYKGIKGVIVSTFKDYIQVRVLRDKIVQVQRDVLKGKSSVQDDRRSEGSVKSNHVRNRTSRIAN